MASFIQIDYPLEHSGVVRFERGFAALRALLGQAAQGSLLLAAIVSAIMVVANEVVDTWTDGHLLAAWIVMWLVAFGALGLFAAPARRAIARRRTERQQVEQDRQLWELAMSDARVMADISRAMSAQAR